MRDSKRIYEIMNELTEIWQQNPDLRFGQLISNVIGEIMHNEHISDMFFPEDNIWLKGLKAYKESHSIYNYGQNLLKEESSEEV